MSVLQLAARLLINFVQTEAFSTIARAAIRAGTAELVRHVQRSTRTRKTARVQRT